MTDPQVANRLLKEFSAVDQLPKASLESFDAVVMLCAEEVDASGENGERIMAALNVQGKIKPSSPLLYMGTIYHIKGLEDYLTKNKLTPNILYPTRRRAESSWTEIRSLADYLKKKKFEKVLVLTHAYHLPRIMRYCASYLTDQDYDFFPVGHIENQIAQTQAEVQKIIKYAEKGDLPLFI
jgi:hypothetical protein